MRVKWAKTAWLLSVFACVIPDGALAYCRATTIPPDDGCACPSEGLPLYWDEQEQPVYYALNENGFPGVSERALRKVLARSFAHWTDVSCEDEPVLFSVAQLAETTAMTQGRTMAGPNLNVIAHLSAQEFLAQGKDPHAFALTTTANHETTGEIVDADIVFNGGLGPFVICPDEGCKDDEVDIENVVTHEMGHFLGLAHSPVEDATMECEAKTGELKLRSLEADDEAGICAIYGPLAVEERAEALHPEHVQAGCGCRLGGHGTRTPAAHAGWLGLASVLLLWRRRLLARGTARSPTRAQQPSGRRRHS
jgi:Matrixin